MKNEDMPASPVFSSDIGYIAHTATGLTKREHFAAMAMQGFLANGSDDADMLAKASVIAADALLSRLEQTK